jgi:RNA polymerase sigma-70 factor (ECF subfamily)
LTPRSHKLDRHAFEGLYNEHAQGVFGYLAYRCGSRDLAEDLLAETFERALRGRRLFDPLRGNERAWLYSIAMNVLRDQIRRRAAEGRALERVRSLRGPDSGAAPTEPGVGAALQDALASLSVAEREVVALHFGAGLRAQEIAPLTGEPLTTVNGRLYRALDKLRKQLGADRLAAAGETGLP